MEDSPIIFVLVIGIVLTAAGAGWFWRRHRDASASLESHRTTADSVLEALSALLDGDREAAYEALSSLAQRRDAPLTVYFALSAMLRERGHIQRSAHVLQTILARPRLPAEVASRAKIALATDLTALGDVAQAERLIDSLPRKLQKGATLIALKKDAALQQGDWHRAVGITSSLAKAGGPNGEAPADMVAAIAEGALAQGDREAAHRAFQKALRLQPDSVRARAGLANLLLQEGRPAKARKHLMAMLDTNPALSSFLLSRVRETLDGSERQIDEKYGELLDSLEAHPEAHVWVELERADSLYRRHDVEACRDLLEAVVARHPKSVEAHEAYLNLLLDTDDEVRLRVEIERFIDLAAEEIRRFRCGGCNHDSARPFMACPVCRTVGSLRYDSTD